MVGRGAVEKPWLCAEIGHHIFGIPSQLEMVDKRDVFETFTKLLDDRFAKEKRLRRLKQFTRYYAGSFKFGHQLASRIQSSKSIPEAKERAEQFFTTTAQVELTL